MPVGMLRRRRGLALRRIEQGQRLGGAADRGFADVVGMGEAGHLPRHAAQAEARIGRIIGGLQPPVIEAEALARPILKVRLAIVAAFPRLGGPAARAGGRPAENTAELPSLKRTAFSVF